MILNRLFRPDNATAQCQREFETCPPWELNLYTYRHYNLFKRSIKGLGASDLASMWQGLVGSLGKSSQVGIMGCAMDSSNACLNKRSESRISGPPTPCQKDPPRGLAQEYRDCNSPMNVDRTASTFSDSTSQSPSVKMDPALGHFSLRRSGLSLPPRSPIPNPPFGGSDMQPMVTAMMDAVQRNLLN